MNLQLEFFALKGGYLNYPFFTAELIDQELEVKLFPTKYQQLNLPDGVPNYTTIICVKIPERIRRMLGFTFTQTMPQNQYDKEVIKGATFSDLSHLFHKLKLMSSLSDVPLIEFELYEQNIKIDDSIIDFKPLTQPVSSPIKFWFVDDNDKVIPKLKGEVFLELYFKEQ